MISYLAVTGFRSERELAAYLYSHAKILDVGTTFEGRMWATVEISEDADPQYQADRLDSGMIGASVHPSLSAAALAILRRV